MDANLLETVTARSRRRIAGRKGGWAALIAVLLAGATTLPGSAATLPGDATLMDPWTPLATVLRNVRQPWWDCVGLPRPTPMPDVGPVSGTASCVGMTCAWDLDDDRLDGVIETAGAGACLRPRGVSTVDPSCEESLLVLVGRPGRWVGAWSTFAADDRLVILAGAGSLDGLVFVGHWTALTGTSDRVSGIVTRDRSALMLLGPIPSR